MSIKKFPMLLLATAGMELSWLLAMGVLLLSLVGVSPLSLPQAVAAFFVGTGLTLFIQKQKWRIIYKVGAYFFPIAALLMHTLYSLSYGGELFWSRRWVEALLQGPQDMEQGTLWAAAIFIMFVFWSSGVFLARRPAAYFATTSRFDVGITAFILIFIIVGVTGAPVTPVLLLLFPFFLTSMVAIALARNQKGDERGAFQQKYRGNGPVLAFAAVVLLGGGAVILFFLPFLTVAAEAGHSAVLQYGQPLSTLLGRAILFVFGYGGRMRSTPPAQGGNDTSLVNPEVESGDAGFWELLLGWGAMGAIIVITVFIAGWGIWNLLRWLMSGAETSGKGRGIKALLFAYLHKWCSFWQRMLRWIRSAFSRLMGGRTEGEAFHFFRRLLIWGHWSGFNRLPAETPREYGLVLGRHFPKAQQEIEFIIHCFNDEVYGKTPLEREKKRRIRRAWRRLCSPWWWPRRFYKRLTCGVSIKPREVGSLEFKVWNKGKGR